MRSPWMSSSYKKMDGLKCFQRKVEGQTFTILLNEEIGSWMVFTDEDIKRYDNDQLNELEMESLYLRGLALDDQGEMVEFDFPKPEEYPSVVVVNITTTCNLRCKYCFADCGPIKGEFMSEEVMRLLIEQMFQMPTPLVTFELQGGEPLCFKDGIEKFCEISESLKDKYGKRVQYRTVTNCTLIDDRFIELAKKYNIITGVSLDGPKECTDQLRIRADGTGAFDDIMAGIARLRAAGLDVDGAVCTVGQHNCSHPKEVVDFFAQQGISFKPRPANKLGRELTNNTTTKDGEWAECYKQMYYRSKEKGIENFSIHIYEENIYTPIRDYICMRYPCGAAREVISVNPNGDVFPCDGFKGEKEFVIGNLLQETLVDMLNKDWVITLKNRTAESIPQCSKCMFRSMCCSCCYSAYGEFGTIYREDPTCADRRKIFMFLFDEWIRQNILGIMPKTPE